MFSLLQVNTCNRVLESCFFRIVNYFIYLFIIATDTFQKGLFIIYSLYLVKGYGIIRCTIVFVKRVTSFLLYIFSHT